MSYESYIITNTIRFIRHDKSQHKNKNSYIKNYI